MSLSPEGSQSIPPPLGLLPFPDSSIAANDGTETVRTRQSGDVDIATKRALLSSARLRFSSEIQPVREAAIDRIVEQNMLLAGPGVWLSATDICSECALCLPGGAPTVTESDTAKSLDRLARSGRARADVHCGCRVYQLSEQAVMQLHATISGADRRFQLVAQRLFHATLEGPEFYGRPFLDCLCIIFSKLADTYVRLIKGDRGVPTVLNHKIVADAIAETTSKHLLRDREVFRSGVLKFFDEQNPDYDAIKWNMAQNYYVARALGLDPSGRLLSREILSDAVFYLDTNVIIPAIEPLERGHHSFQALSKACSRLNIDIRACQISINELRRVTAYHVEILNRVGGRIPAESVPKIRNVFLRLYQEQAATGQRVDFDRLFQAFWDPTAALAGSYGVTLEDDAWFVDAETDPETQMLAQALQQTASGRYKQKGASAARHDALMLRWISRQSQDGPANARLITLDTSLAGFIDPRAPGQGPIAITLDAVLQWISPMLVCEDDDDQFAAVFSDAVRYFLLPQESFFELKDFLMLAAIEWDCRELPAEDVEDCLRYLKRSAPELDLSTPQGRERVTHEISRFFADPGRKYKQDLQRLEQQNGNLKKQNEKEAEESAKAIAQREARIKALESERLGIEAQMHTQALRASAVQRLTVVGVGLLLCEIAAIYLAVRYGSGVTALQKIVSVWPVLSLPVLASIPTSWLTLGNERIEALGGRLSKLLEGGR